MRNYTVVTPLRRNGKLTQPGKTVQLEEREGDPLAAIGALERGEPVKAAVPPPPPPPSSPPPPPTPAPRTRSSKRVKSNG